MRIFLTGSTGYIGGHILKALSCNGHQITCLVRTNSKKRLLAQIEKERTGQSVRIVEGNWIEPQHWLDELADHDILINAVGIIRESFNGEFDVVHCSTPIAMFARARECGIKKIIQISALGADDTAQGKFHLSKRKSDNYLSTLDIPYLILRPSFVYGHGGSSMALFSRLAALPVIPVPGDGQYPIQPIHVRDVLKAIEIAVNADKWQSVIVDVGGGQVLTFDELLTLLGKQLGRDVRHLHIPWIGMEIIAKITDLFSGFGPINTEELNMLRRGNVCDNSKFIETFGFQPVAFSQAAADAICR